MHTIQKETITRYRQKFPKHTFREISEKTGIQLTRVFRIVNGYEMRLTEYLAFQKAINHSGIEQCGRSHDLQFINEHFFKLDEQTTNDLKRKIEYKVELNKLSSTLLH